MADNDLNQRESDKGQNEQFVRMFSQHSHRIRCYIFALILDHADTDEVFQNTSCLLWQKFHTFDVNTSFLAWAFRVAYLEVCNFRRVKGRRPILNDEIMQLVAAEASDSLEHADPRQEMLEDCLTRLKQAEREILNLRFYEQLQPKRISAVLGVSVHSVYRSLSRVYDQLLTCIQKKLSDSESPA